MAEPFVLSPPKISAIPLTDLAEGQNSTELETFTEKIEAALQLEQAGEEARAAPAAAAAAAAEVKRQHN